MAKELSAALAHECLFIDFLSEEEPKKVFRNKQDETRIVIKNKVRLVAQDYNQQEGIDYDETFAPVARVKAIRIFLAYATYVNFIVIKWMSKVHSKMAQQAAGGPSSLEAISEEGAHPHLSSGTNPNVLVDKTKSARDELKTAHADSGINEEFRVDENSKKIKLKDLSDLIKDTRSAFLTPDSPQDEPLIVLDESEEEETIKDKDTPTTSHDVLEDTLVPHPSSPKSA
nr:retrovirus-related Pol polyprotein from transposon TNT 1-94 [Tanacetum cinerariifolium]